MSTPRSDSRPAPPARTSRLEQFIRSLTTDYHWCQLRNCPGSDEVLERLDRLAHGGDGCGHRTICREALLSMARDLPSLPDLTSTPYGMWVVMLLLTELSRGYPEDYERLSASLETGWVGSVRAAMVAHSEEKRRRLLAQAERERLDQLRSAARRQRRTKA